ncbi:MAG: hypothetical protein JWO06_2036, partial [Bacteroidota bacterium]|nr:hypothetical protein [Bacteroidota bacterium]
MKRFSLSSIFILAVFFLQAQAQTCTGGGDQVTYGNGSWIGYVYDASSSGARDFATYRGFVTEATDNFDRNWGSGATNKPSCSVN